MLHLEKVNGNNVWDILKLTVSESQKNFVAANEISIIEAYTAITGNGHAFPFGIYEDVYKRQHMTTRLWQRIFKH